jgi:RNA polymerase sigma factor (sigma-70 family)
LHRPTRWPTRASLSCMGDSKEVDEIEECARREYPRLVGIVAAACGSTSLAEEAVQTAFVKAIERARRGHVIDRVPAWVVKVAINETRSKWRRHRVEQKGLAELNGRIAQDDADRAALVDLDAALRSLPTRQQQAVVLHYLLGLDVVATAEVLNVSAGTVKKAMSRARARLATELEER